MSLISSLARALKGHRSEALSFGCRSYSGDELQDLAEGLRLALIDQGVKRADRVALYLPNHPAFVISALAVWALGATLVPLHHAFRLEECVKLLRMCRPDCLLFLPNDAQMALQLQAALPPLRLRLLELQMGETDPELEGLLGSPSAAKTRRPALPSYRLTTRGAALATGLELTQLPAVVHFTSGTTGQPKAVVLSQHNLLTNGLFIAREWLGGLAAPLETAALAEVPRQRVLAALPLSHNFGVNVTIGATLLHGGCLELLPRFSAGLVMRALLTKPVTVLPLVPAMMSALERSPERARLAETAVRLVVSGGAPLPWSVRAALLEVFPRADVRNTYGLSETSLVACTEASRVGKPHTVGRPIAETEVTVVDDEGRTLPPLQIGEVRVKGPGVMSDYLERPEGISPPVQNGYLMTGDLGYLDEEGDLFLVDRKKDLIIHGGMKVYPIEVEEVLLRHPSVAEAAVFGIPDRRMGEIVMACVVLREGHDVSPAALVLYCRTVLAEYKLPRRVELCATLPRGGTGKVKKALLRTHWAGDVDCG